VIALLLAGCAWRVQVLSTPVPAEITLPGEDRAVTPAEVRLRWVPFGKQWVTVSAKGYRPIEANLRRDEIRFFRYVGTTLRGGRRFGDEKGARGEVRYILVPDHGPVGTWNAEDIPQN
jgi:hypothetical protein